jgi:hypothetical protein
LVARHDPGADLERRYRARHGPLGQPAAAGDAFAEPHDPRQAVEHFEAVATRPGHQQATVVGAQIEGGKDRPARAGGLGFVARYNHGTSQP